MSGSVAMASVFSRNPVNVAASVGKAGESPKKEFPAGLRVLVVDDDPICLLILEKMLRRCAYDVTTCNQATTALAMLRGNKNGFDLVISDVYMPDMDGFKLLELVGLEMDLPVIMMSADGETSNVMKGITHGACDYLLKPVRIEELRNIWQHVWRKRRNEVKEVEHSNSVEDSDRMKRPSEDAEFTSSSNNKKRKDANEEEDDNEHEIDDPTTLKKPRVVWSVELHQQFVSAVNKLGIDKAVPKRILEIMNVQGLTRENVASHLQKYRLYLKRLSSGPQSNGMNLSFTGSQDASLFNTLSSLEGINGLQSLAASGHLTAQALASVQSNVIGRLGNMSGMGPPTLNPSVLLQLAALQGGSAGSFQKPRVVAPVIKQGSLYQSTPGGLEMDQQSCTQNVSVINPLENLREHAMGASILQHQFVSDSVGGMRSLGASCENLSTSLTGNPMLMHFLQQQQQQAKQQADVGSMPPGQQIHPGDFSANSGSLNSMRTSSLNTDVGFSALNGSIPPAVSYGLNNLYSTSHIDSDNLSLLSLPSSSNPPGTCITGTGIANTNVSHPSPMKNFTNAGIFDENFAAQPMRSTIMPFSTVGRVHNNIVQDPNHVKRIARQGQTMGVSQDFVADLSPIQSPCNSQILSNSQLHAIFGQGHAQNHEVMAQGLSFTTKSDDGFMRPRSSQCSSDQSNIEVNLKLKQEPVSDSVTATLDNALSAMKASSPDDLLALLLKQQREMASYGGRDLALEKFSPGNT